MAVVVVVVLNILIYSKGLGTSSGNLLNPLPKLFTICHTI
jgi:hypothetical protein